MVKVANDPSMTIQDLPADTGRRHQLGELFGGLVTVPDDAGAPELRALALRQAAALEREDEVHRFLLQAVLDGGSVDEVCAQLVKFVGGAVLVTTTDGRVTAEAGDPEARAAARQSGAFDRTGRLIVEAEPVGVRSLSAPDPTDTSTGASTSTSTGTGKGTATAGPGPEGWHDRATVRIVAGSGEEGRLGVFTDRPLTAADIHVMERAATVVALTLTREQAVSAVESKYRSEFLRDAISGRAGSPAEAVAHAESLGWSLGARMVVVAAVTDEDDEVTDRTADEVRALQQRFTRAWVRAVSARDHRTPVMGFRQEVVALLAVPDHATTDTVVETVTDLVRVVSGDGGGGRRTFSTGISRVVTSPDDLVVAYREATTAVRVGRQVHGESAITAFDRLGIYRLLSLVPDSEDLGRFVTEALGELATDDSPENADLRRTLEVLLETNLNVAEASRALFFHYNTLRYRIAKLERILGPFTTDPNLRLTLALALKVVEMRGLLQRSGTT